MHMGIQKNFLMLQFGKAELQLLFTPASCTCCMVSEPVPKCLLCGILCASIVAIHTKSS